MAAADADAAHQLAVDGDRVAAAEDHEPVDAGRRAVRERRVVLDEVVPAVRRHPEADRRVRLVLRDLDAEQRRAVHAPERLEHAAVVDDGDHHRRAISLAFASAAAMSSCAASVLMLLFGNVCATALSSAR
ncbi:MAG TPA: hypothetical protein VHF51_15315 [Solirubrobacteraceae bacterium]|nr:hypothetical protein [Solirubrobacteraceae bacterium]